MLAGVVAEAQPFTPDRIDRVGRINVTAGRHAATYNTFYDRRHLLRRANYKLDGLGRGAALLDWTGFERLLGYVNAAPVGRPSYGPVARA